MRIVFLVGLLSTGLLSTVSGLVFNSATVSTTINGQQPASLLTTFIPGVRLVSGDTITVSPIGDTANNIAPVGIFNTVSNSAVSAMGNCTSSTAASAPVVAGGLAVVTVTLGPSGCLLPIGFTQNLVIPQGFLTSNANNAIVLLSLATSKETSAQPLFAYTTGTSTIKSWTSAAPTPTLAGVVPSSVSFAFTTQSALAAGQTITLVPSPMQVFVMTSQAVNVGSNLVNCPITGATVANSGLSMSRLVLTVPSAAQCAAGIPAGTTLVVTVNSGLVANPFPVGSAISWGVFTTSDGAMLQQQTGWTTTGGCGTSAQPVYTPGLVNDISSMSPSQLAALGTSVDNQAGVQGGLQCLQPVAGANTSALVTYWNVPSSTYVLNNVSMKDTPEIAINNWGAMFTVPMTAVIVSYPLVAASFASLGIPPEGSPSYEGRGIAFILKVDRIDTTRQLRNDNNQFQFVVGNDDVDKVLVFSQPNTTGLFVASPNGSVECDRDACLVSANYSHTFVGLLKGGGSPLGLLGLLGLIAIPVCCCCCIPLALFFLRRRSSGSAYNQYNPRWVPHYYPGPMPMGPSPWGMPPMPPPMRPMPMMPYPSHMGPMSTPMTPMGTVSSMPMPMMF